MLLIILFTWWKIVIAGVLFLFCFCLLWASRIAGTIFWARLKRPPGRERDEFSERGRRDKEL